MIQGLPKVNPTTWTSHGAYLPSIVNTHAFYSGHTPQTGASNSSRTNQSSPAIIVLLDDISAALSSLRLTDAYPRLRIATLKWNLKANHKVDPFGFGIALRLVFPWNFQTRRKTTMSRKRRRAPIEPLALPGSSRLNVVHCPRVAPFKSSQVLGTLIRRFSAEFFGGEF